jgi:hypothetical protein
MYPDSVEANKHGCACPAMSGGNEKGGGTLIDGVRSWTVNPDCKIHGDPKWWCRRPTLPEAVQP